MKTETLSKSDLRNIEVKIDQLSELIQKTFTVLIEQKDTTGVIQNTIKEKLNEERKDVYDIPFHKLQTMQNIVDTQYGKLNNWQMDFFNNMLMYKKASARQLELIDDNISRF